MTTLTFVTPPPGLAARRFELLTEQGDGVYTLSALDTPGVEMLVLDPGRWVPGYSPAIPSSDLARIGAEDTDPLVLVVASVRAGGVHANLLAPVLVHPDTGAAVQSVLDGQGLDLRRTLVTA
ncbi:flagellar assembly protein FliW [Cellulosimicrobium sp. TH-20]|uniref:flagellar assembly protein FliW n=1 Tax=Cellulosimicrobium TaxID=157920 RepID=UPI0011A791CE|nr:flagellar assembly protein FliW [Cellulosimicrobium sp. TH-20]